MIVKLSYLTGRGGNGHYHLGLLSGLIHKPIKIDVIGSNVIMNSNILKNVNVNFLNYLGDRSPNVPIWEKTFRILMYYYYLIKYTIKTDSKIYHIQWMNKFIYFDRTILILFYKLFGKKIILTAHNIDEKERDGKNNIFNKISLKFLYNNVNGLIVHTEKMKSQLIANFNVQESKITVIPHGIMDVVPTTTINNIEARNVLGLNMNEKVILFFGNIAPYKGLDDLINALIILNRSNYTVKLIIAGKVKDCKTYWDNIDETIRKNDLRNNLLLKIKHIPDEEIELYFKSADALVLPYKYIFQSGVIFLSYYFGLPVIATDVGSLKEEIDNGINGYLCKPKNPKDIANTIEIYFESDLYTNLEKNRMKIKQYADEKYSWEKIGDMTYGLYKRLE